VMNRDYLYDAVHYDLLRYNFHFIFSK